MCIRDSTPPASNVYVVTGGKQDQMIPAVPEFIVETNIDEGYLRAVSYTHLVPRNY